MSRYLEALPSALGSARAVAVLFDAVKNARLPHGILFYGGSQASLESVVIALASEILGVPAEKCIDFHTIRPANKSRTISIDNTLALVREIQQSPAFGDKKVAVVYDAERMGKDAANAFLKTLEEPPAGTFIFLMTAAINKVLPTIHSRCLHFRIPGDGAIDEPEWLEWLEDFEKWISSLTRGKAILNVGTSIFTVYALTVRFQALVKKISDTEWERVESTLPETVDTEQKDAMQVGAARGVRHRLLAAMQESLLQLSLQTASGKPCVAEIARSCALLEHLNGLLELNMQDGAVIEAFLLNCLRIWTKAPPKK